ncbi:MAG: DUF3667 domain-containing protein [Caulobacteraceae bacterium]
MDRNLEIAAAASAGGLTKWRAARAARIGAPCANCATPLAGPYCHACGQLAEDFERSIGSLIVELVENLFHADGRLFRTLPRLVLHPATLTRDYPAGRRAFQIPPLRLFLVIVVLFFLAGSLRGLFEPARVTAGGHLGHVPSYAFAGAGPTVKAVAAWATPKTNYALAHPREFTMQVDSWLHRVAIAFLPISAAILGLLFIFNRRFYIFDHAIFSMHSLSFQGLLFTAITLLAIWRPLQVVGGLLVFAAPVHLFVHMRGVYATSVLGTLIRMFLLGLLSAIALGLLMLAVVAAGLTTMGSS